MFMCGSGTDTGGIPGKEILARLARLGRGAGGGRPVQIFKKA